MKAPDMRAVVEGLIGRTIFTVVRKRPNTVVRVTGQQALVRTAGGHENPASLRELQEYADRAFDGEEVLLPTRGRSAFHMAVLVLLPEIDFSPDPRRVWLADRPASVDLEFDELVLGGGTVDAEGRARFKTHRVRERKPSLRRKKLEQAAAEGRTLECEVCGFLYEARYGDLGAGFIECHHTTPLAEGERDTTLDDLALVCASCHRMIHRREPMLSLDELRALLVGPP